MEAMTADRIAGRIRRLREDRGLSQAELARAAELSQTAVSAIERGDTRNVGVVTLLNIADALKVDIDALLKDAPATVAA